jgi:hypothetical protein
MDTHSSSPVLPQANLEIAMRDHDHKINCLMNAGKPLRRDHADVLLFNAVDMFEQRRKMQRIKSRNYDGMIESNLEVIDYMGEPVVAFVSYIETERWQTNIVDFVVRVEDLNCPPAEWNHLLRIALDFSVNDLPAPIKEHIANGGDPEDLPRLRFSDLPPQVKEYVNVMREKEYE